MPVLPEFSDYRRTTLIASRPVATDQIVVELQAWPEALAAHARPGQFCRMRLYESGQGHEGIFAMMTAPHERALRFLVRTPNPEGGEAAEILARRAVGDTIEATDPAGPGFDLSLAHARDLHVIATGTAIAPARAALEHVLRERDRYGALSIDHGLRSPAHLAIPVDLDRWRALGVAVRVHYSEPRADGTIGGVRVQDAVLENVRDMTRAAFVAVGQPAMVNELRQVVRARGGDPDLVLHNY